MNTFDDELDEIPTKPQTTEKAHSEKKTSVNASPKEDTPKTAQTNTNEPKPPALPEDAYIDEDNLDVDFGDLKLMAKGDGLTRIRADKNKAVRLALLNFIPAKSAQSHFVEGKDKKGSFRCLPSKDGELPFCCSKLGEEGMVHVVALALHYTNAKPSDGKYDKGTPIEWEIGYVDLSRSNYRSVSNLAPEEGSVYDIDIIMTKKTSGIGYEFTSPSPKARWKQNPELVAEVEEAAKKYVNDGGKKLTGKLGKKLNLLEWKALLSETASSAEEASLEDISDL